MKRGELYRVALPPGDARRTRVFLVISRDGFLDTSHSSATCVPVYSSYHGLHTEVLIGEPEGLKGTSVLQCDLVTSVNRSLLTHYVGSLSPDLVHRVNRALAIALALDSEDTADANDDPDP